MKAVVSDLSAVPEPLRGEYVPLPNGGFRANIEGELPGYVPAEKLVEFRDTNVRVLKALGVDSVDAALQRASLFAGIDSDRLAKLKGLDPDEYAKLKEQAEKLAKRGVKDPDVDLEALAARIVKPLQDKLAEFEKRDAEKQKRIDASAMREAIGAPAVELGAFPDAVEFLVSKAEREGVFFVEGGTVKATPGRYSADSPTQPLTPKEWLVSQSKTHPSLFGQSKGGGATSAGAGAGASAQKLGTFRTSGGAELKTEGITVLS